jgi:4'-phosphopantetheinyl transferase
MGDKSIICDEKLQSRIEVWSIDLGGPLNPKTKLDQLLSTEERARARSYIFAKDANRFRMCRAMLRLGLAKYLGRDPRTIELVMNSYGKPYLPEAAGLWFNVSHSGNMGLIAFATVGEVGIDVEARQDGIEVLEIAAANFTYKEQLRIAAAVTQEEQISIFLRLWTRKEAVLKAVGRGIGSGLEMVDVAHESLNLVYLADVGERTAETCWKVMDLELADGYAAALAAPAGEWSVSQRTMNYEIARADLNDGTV